MAEARDYTRLVPFQPPEGLKAWTMERAPELQENRLIYKADWEADPITGMKHRVAAVWCSACGRVFHAGYHGGGPVCHNGYMAQPAPFGFVLYASLRDAGEPGELLEGTDMEIVWSGNETTCPLCGAKVKATHCGTFRYEEHLGAAWPVTVGRVENKLVLTGWYVARDVVKTSALSGVDPWRIGRPYRVEETIRPHEAYVVEEKKLIRMKAYDKFMSTILCNDHWKQNKKYTDEWGTTKLVYPWDPALLTGTTAENSKLDIYLQSAGNLRPMTYLDCWTKRKNVENLVVQGAGELLNSVFDSCVTVSYSYYASQKCTWRHSTRINWTQKKPAKMLGLTKDEFRTLLRVEPSDRALYLFQAMKAVGQTLRTDEEVRECIDYGCNNARFLAERGFPVLKIIRYLAKQKRKYPLEKDLIDEKHLLDFWDMSEKVGDKLETQEQLFPQHLTAMHDAVLGRMKFREQKELQGKFRELAEKLAWMAWEADGISVRVAASESELIAEGKALGHCVGTYAKSHAEGKRCIFFVRRAEAPSTPWYTLELSLGDLHVMQNRGRHNCARTKEVQAFEKKWLEHLQELRARKNGAKFAPKQTERKAG